MISHIDLCIALVAVLTLVVAARRPHPVHPATAIILTLLTGVLIWANLRPTAWQEDFGGSEQSPPGLDPVSRAMFFRGWPLAPCMFCLIHSLRFHRSGIEPLVLVFDGVVFVVALYATKAACERLRRWRRHGNVRSMDE
jgi:hypothetical protein